MTKISTSSRILKDLARTIATEGRLARRTKLRTVIEHTNGTSVGCNPHQNWFRFAIYKPGQPVQFTDNATEAARELLRMAFAEVA